MHEHDTNYYQMEVNIILLPLASLQLQGIVFLKALFAVFCYVSILLRE